MAMKGGQNTNRNFSNDFTFGEYNEKKKEGKKNKKVDGFKGIILFLIFILIIFC